MPVTPRDASAFDTVIVGGGHNGLVAAAYLARAGRSVLVLERLGHTGGAAVSTRPFAGVDARLSRYSYLVSLLPQQIIDDLGLRLRRTQRGGSPPTRPTVRDGRATACSSAVAQPAPGSRSPGSPAGTGSSRRGSASTR